MNKDDISLLGDYDAPFCEQQYKHGSCYISLFKFKSFDQFNTPQLSQILDIYSVVALQDALRLACHKVRWIQIIYIISCYSRPYSP